jgi:hypothetical protein
MTRLVVLSAGPAAQVKALQADLAQSLATALQRDWDDCWQHLGPGDDPNKALQHLQCRDAGPGLAAPLALLGLPLDPGLPLARGGHWAEALGAWRQPVVLLLRADQLQTGLPAAMTALLERWQVPLVGLIQGGEPWEWVDRRRDGLPWLGALPTKDLTAASELRSALDLALRCRLS